jgi:hypothetical protein
MMEILAKNSGKFSVIFRFRLEGNCRETSRISLSRKKSINTENFTGKENAIIINNIKSISLNGQGGKKGGLMLRPPSFLPLPLTKENFKKGRCKKNG